MVNKKQQVPIGSVVVFKELKWSVVFGLEVYSSDFCGLHSSFCQPSCALFVQLACFAPFLPPYQLVVSVTGARRLSIWAHSCGNCKLWEGYSVQGLACWLVSKASPVISQAPNLPFGLLNAFFYLNILALINSL